MRKLILVAVAVLTLTGCTPGVVGFAGIQRIDQSFRAVVVMCDESSISHVELRDRSQVNDKDEYQVIEQWPVGNFANHSATAVIPSDSVFPTRLGDGQYMLWGTVPGLFPAYVSGPIFDALELEGLHEGDILTSTWTSMDNVIYPNLNEMASAVEEFCG